MNSLQPKKRSYQKDQSGHPNGWLLRPHAKPTIKVSDAQKADIANLQSFQALAVRKPTCTLDNHAAVQSVRGNIRCVRENRSIASQSHAVTQLVSSWCKAKVRRDSTGSFEARRIINGGFESQRGYAGGCDAHIVQANRARRKQTAATREYNTGS